MTSEEHTRHAILTCLYGTRAIKVAASFIQRDVGRDTGADGKAVAAELVFLTAAKLITAETESLGSTLYYQITPEGILHHERNR